MASVDLRPKISCDVSSLVRQQLHDDAVPMDSNPPSEILDGFLFLGDAENAMSLGQLNLYGISRILSVTTMPELGKHEGIERIFLSIRDSEDEDISILFSPACEFIQQAKAAGQRILVHCMAGRSRSASLVLAFLMRVEHMALHNAFLMTKQRRPLTFPNVGFWQQLMEEELRLFGSNSETPSAYKLAMDIKSGVRELSPQILLKRYITASLLEDPKYSEEQKNKAADDWPDGWPAAKCVNELFIASIDHLENNARTLAVEFIWRLLSKDRFTRPEVVEAFGLLKSMDLDDLRIDVPKVDAYIAEMYDQAQVYNLLS